MASRDPRIKERIYFYADSGRGITPEQGVGSVGHTVNLNNVYDANADTWVQAKLGRDFASNNDWLNGFESAVLDNGFDGYISDFGTQRAVVLLGRHSVKVSPVSGKPATAVPTAATPITDRVAADRKLPSGRMTGAEWKRMVPEATMLEDEKSYYKDDVVSQLRGAKMSPARSGNIGGMADKDTVAGTQAPTSAGDGSTGSAMPLTSLTYSITQHDDPRFKFKLTTELAPKGRYFKTRDDAEQAANQFVGQQTDLNRKIARLYEYGAKIEKSDDGKWSGYFDLVDGRKQFAVNAITKDEVVRIGLASMDRIDREKSNPEEIPMFVRNDILPDVKAGYTRFWHGSGTYEGLSEITEGGLFGGLFAAYGEDSAHGPGSPLRYYYIDVKDSDRASHADLKHDFDADNGPALFALKKFAIDGASDADLLDIAEKVVDDTDSFIWDHEEAGRSKEAIRVSNLLSPPYDWPGESFKGRNGDNGFLLWFMQKLRGEVAKAYGYKAVNMNDEHGISVLILPGNKLNKVDIENPDFDFAKFNPNNAKTYRQFREKSQNEPSASAGSDADVQLSPARQPIFYSQLARAVEQAPDRIFSTGAQLKLWLAGNKAKLGIKDDEIQWSGINEYLASLGKGRVSKADVLGYLEQGGVQVEEVEKGKQGYDEDNPQLPPGQGLRVIEATDGADGYEVLARNDRVIGTGLTEAMAIADAYSAEPQYWEDGSETKYGSYTLPGGENYRELLLTLPSKSGAEEKAIIDELQALSWSDNDRRTVLQEKLRSLESQKQYRSNHWDEKNILAHIRFNERTDADGARVLFVEEIQSDWGQDGKKKGFVQKAGELPAGWQVFEEKAKYGGPSSWYVVDNTKTQVGLYQTTREAAIASATNSEGFNGGVPQAPFVTKTESWLDLALKRMMRYAADNGFDKIAFVTGEQSAERYDLSKKIKQVTVKKWGEQWNVKAYDIGDSQRISEFIDDIAKLDDLIGKDAADKARSQIDATGSADLRGLDLKVGGEGMKAFYDQIVPQRVNALLKKLGGGKVEMVSIKAPYKNAGDRNYRVNMFREKMYAKYGNGIMLKMTPSELAELRAIEDGGTIMQQPGFTVPAAAAEPMALFSKSRTPLPEETTARKAQRIVQDKFNRFTVIRDWLREQGVQLSEAADVYKAEERMHSRFANTVQDFREKLVEPLVERIQKAGYSMDDVALFLHAQHAPSRNAQIAKVNKQMPDGGSGMLTADALAVVAAAPAELKALANEFRDITEMTKQVLLDSGVISQEMVDAWEATYDHYVPLKGGPDDKAVAGTGKGLNVNGKMKRALGHSKREGGEWIVENILADYERAVMLAEKNRVGHHLLKMAMEVGRDDIITVGKPEKRAVLRDHKSYEVSFNGAVLGAFHTIDAARAFIAIEAGKANKLKSAFSIKASNDPSVAYMASPMLQDNEANVYVNGSAIRVQINDELLARAYKNLGAEPLNAVLQGGRMLNGFLSKIYTGYNPEFIITNVVRDFTTGLANITGEEGAMFATKSAKNYFGAFGELLRYAATGVESQAIKNYRADGGNTGAAYLSDLERLGKEIQTEYKAALGVTANLAAKDYAGAARAAGRKVFNKTIRWIEVLNMAGENAMRLAVYNTAVQNGKTRTQAASLAKNVTVNFNRKGEMGAQANALYLFFNAGVQGTSALAHAHIKGKHKRQAWAVSSGMMMLGYAVAAAFGGGDEDEYDKLSDYEKDRNLMIKVGDGWLKIPVPYGYGFFWNLGRGMSDAIRKDDMGKLPWHLASSFVGEFSPFGGIVAGDKPDMRQGVYALPTAFQIPGALAVNRTGMGGPIFPDSSYDKFRPDNLAMWRNTKGSMADDMAQVLAQVGLEVSPETLKYLGRTFTGGAGAFVGSTVDAAALTAQGADLEVKEMPFVRKFYKEMSVADARSAYYKAREQAEEAASELSRAQKAGDFKTMRQIMSDDRELIAMDKYADRLQKMIKASRDRQDAVKAEGKHPVAWQRAMLKQMEQDEQKLYDQYLATFKTRMEERRARQ